MWLSKHFTDFATRVAHASGRPLTFVLAIVVIAVWAVTGPLFGYSDAWQLVINTGTTIVTFLMVFLIQNTQNRDGAAIQAKLDEIRKRLEDGVNGDTAERMTKAAEKAQRSARKKAAEAAKRATS